MELIYGNRSQEQLVRNCFIFRAQSTNRFRHYFRSFGRIIRDNRLRFKQNSYLLLTITTTDEYIIIFPGHFTNKYERCSHNEKNKIRLHLCICGFRDVVLFLELLAFCDLMPALKQSTINCFRSNNSRFVMKLRCVIEVEACRQNSRILMLF